jgi:hypothetical protein
MRHGRPSLSSLELQMKSMKVCTRNPYFESTKLINLDKIRRRRGITMIKRAFATPKQGAKIKNKPTLPRVLRNRSFRITEMPYLVYPKMRLTSIRQIRPHDGDVEGTVIICSNALQRRPLRELNWPPQ